MTGTSEKRILDGMTELVMASQNQIRDDVSDMRSEMRAGFQRMGERMGAIESSPAQRLTDADIANIQTGAKVLAAGKWALGPKRVGALLTLAGSGGALVVINRIREWFF
jgi:hypothetical protein